MFRSRQRDRILTQCEHSRFSGLLAWHWGNHAFERPSLAHDAFANGVALHDWHYGPFDDHPLGEYDAGEWLSIVERGVAMHYDNPITDAVAKRHLRRLIGTPDEPTIQSLADRLDDTIAQRRAETPYTDAEFEWADRITRFCDTVAFDLGFEHFGQRRAAVPARRDTTAETDIRYEIRPDGRIAFEPWPFASSIFGMPLLQYQAKGYPERGAPIVTFVRCEPGA